MRNMKKHMGQEVYNLFMKRPLDNIPGGPNNPKKASSILHQSFWSGYNKTKFFRGERGSFCEAAWFAGKDRRKLETK